MAEYKKTLPTVDALSRPFWEAAKRHEFFLQRCRECGRWHFPASDRCRQCHSEKAEWVKASGRGNLASWIVVHKVYHPAFAGDVPYVVGVVELEEGPRYMGNIVQCDRERLRMGTPVEVTFDDVTEEISLPKFRPTRHLVEI